MLTETTLLLILVAGLVIVLLMVVKMRRLATGLERQARLLAMVKQEMDALLVCEKGMGKRIKDQQQQVLSLVERQDKMEISDGANTGYKQAMVLLQKGASTDELIDACDLSRGELELLSHLSSYTTPAKPARVA